MEDLKSQLVTHEERLSEAEKRISTVEDTDTRHERTLRYLLHREMQRINRCEDLSSVLVYSEIN